MATNKNPLQNSADDSHESVTVKPVGSFLPERNNRTQLRQIREREKPVEKENPKSATLHSPEEIISTAEQLLEKAGTSIDALYKERNAQTVNFVAKKKAPFKKSVKPPAVTEGEQNVNPVDPFGPIEIPGIQPETKEEKSPENTAASSENQSSVLTAKNVNLNYKRGFFHYLGVVSLIAILGATGFICYQSIMKVIGNDAVSPDEIALVDENSENDLDLTTSALKPIDPASPLLEKARRTFADYISADNKRFAFSFVQIKPNTKAAFDKYWEPATEAFTEENLKFIEGYQLPNGIEWLSFSYESESVLRKVYLQRNTDENFLLDWHTFSEVEAISLPDLMADTTLYPYPVRAWVTRGDRYTRDYPESHWLSLKATNLEGNTAYFYVPKGTNLLSNLTKGIIKDRQDYPMEKGKRGAYVRLVARKEKADSEDLTVLDVQSTSWAQEVRDLQNQ